MKKKFYIIPLVIIFVLVFSTAALCNMCAAPNKNIGSLEDQAEGISVGDKDDKDANGTASGDGGNGTAKEEPTISLKIYEGPLFESTQNICYYRIEAEVTGEPGPEVVFSKDDSGNTLGNLRAQVNLLDPSDSYTLTATATNSEGSDQDTIDITWGCNKPPEIADIILIGDYYTATQYTITADVSDPEGDTLTYDWSISGGAINDSTINPMEWTTPGIVDTYDISLTVDDGNGGTDTKTIQVDVISSIGPPLGNIDLTIDDSKGGMVGSDGNVYTGHLHWAGDMDTNETRKAFISFDITPLIGNTIVDAELTMTPYMTGNNMDSFKPLVLLAVYWGTDAVGFGDFNITGNTILTSGNSSITCNNNNLKNEIQAAVNNGWTRFQLMLFFTGMSTDNNNDNDIWGYKDANINLNVSYTP